MVNARKSFDDPIEFGAENGTSQRPAMPVIAAASWMEKIAQSFHDVLMDGTAIKPALGAADHSGSELN